MTRKILITSALPYANGPLHFGHIAGAYLPADCYARFQRLMKQDVLYICGSDEYGVAITLSADLAGRTPREHVDIFHKINKDFFDTLRISFDHYSRTTWEGHPETVHQYFIDLCDNGYIEERVTEQLYSEEDKKFLADRYVTGTCPRCGFANARGDECPSCGASYDAVDLILPRSKLTNAPLVRRPTKHWFLLLDKFKDRLHQWLEKKDWKPNVVNFIKGYINELHARAITRDSTWGVPIPLPETAGKVLYVWFDAPIGYISATKDWAIQCGDPDRWKDYWLDENTTLVNFIGKDNIPFHASIFPAMTMGQNLPYKLVDELPANEFYKLEGRQFSKSDGWYIDLEDFFSRYSTDQIRYAIASNAPETSDSEFIWKDFQLRCNSDLLGKYGNLANRVLVFIRNQCGGIIPAPETIEPIDRQFLETVQNLVAEAEESYSRFKVRQAAQIMMELARQGNVYFDGKKPWQDAKQESTQGRMRTTLYCCMECLKALALISFPIIPTAAEQLWTMLGHETELAAADWNAVKTQPPFIGRPIPQPVVLFNRVEDEAIEQEIAKLAKLRESMMRANEAQSGRQKTETDVPPSFSAQVLVPLKPPVDIDDFRKLDLRVGTILKAEPVPKSKKLLQLQIDLGIDKRTVVAGIGESYEASRLIGRKVVIAANLKPATVMGVKSEGMVLAGKENNHLELLFIDSIPPGAVIS